MKILWCLHGNLQLPTVWEPFRQELATITDLELRTVDLWDTLADSCWDWAERFCNQVRETGPNHQHYLLGYSLGGRLGWHSLITAPELWERAIIVSAGVGTEDTALRASYLSRDRIWAERFLQEPWEPLIKEWDDLPVFCGLPCPTLRREVSFERHKIAQGFLAYSQGRMDSLKAPILDLIIPTLYVTGQLDRKYARLGQQLAEHHSHLTHVSISRAGHRVPWENPPRFIAETLSFLKDPAVDSRSADGQNRKITP